MTITNRLSLLFTFLTASIVLVFAVIIYLSGEKSRERAFYKSLNKEAITKANLFFKAKIDTQTLQAIYTNNRSIINEVEVAIYDDSFNLLYHDDVDIDIVKENKKMLHSVLKKKEIRFYLDKWQAIGLKYEYQNKNYIIMAAAYDQNGYHSSDSIKRTILILFFSSILFIYIMGRIFSKKALSPVSNIVANVKVISATNLDLRVQIPNSKDEIAELATTFNEMLNRLEKSFEAQKDFVSNISHELRTPLTAMLTELQLSVSNMRTNEEYQKSITNAINDAQKLVRLSNSLLDLAKANYDQAEIGLKEIRLDEVLLDARNDVMHNQPEFKVNLIFEKEIEDDDFISVKGNEYLLKVAFMNLIENGCKFSEEKESTVAITYFKTKTIIRFQDNGIGINNEDLPNIFTPFFRGDNKNFAGGNGIGLSLTQKIIALHNGSISVVSEPGQGTTFTIELPHI
ncbi:MULTISPECIES: HAMP domain-containing sensor histidine kinase [Flavobacterium]|uniref:sensor histidine kinase n=1 Tax=Flavobacterium TaxID=237 RepID=UPI00095C2EA7|nr:MULTISPECIES: HAMP domain-containing sensor histidine kinase [Flavobacterium]MBN9286129.1 HAMP domain-containing histidine kinase [Flavobacterium sp.]OJV68349.1 MAG: two-component sensor histidine kinase [Flavobacterium sp. 40-81]